MYLSVFHYSAVCQCVDLHFAVLGERHTMIGCFNSHFAIGERLNGAAEFTLGGPPPLFARAAEPVSGPSSHKITLTAH